MDDWSQPVNLHTGATQGFNKRHILPRIVNGTCALPTEVIAVVENIFLTPITAASSVLKIGVKGLAWISGSETLEKVDQKLPGVTDFLKTVANVIRYAIGAISTSTLGFFSPSLNFKFHTSVLGIVVNRREAFVKAALEEEEARKAAELAKKIADEAEAKLKAAQEAEGWNVLEEVAQAYEAIQEADKEKEAEEILEDIKPFFEKAEEDIQTIEENNEAEIAYDETKMDNEAEDIEEAPEEFAKDVEEAIAPEKSYLERLGNVLTFGYFFNDTKSEAY